MGRERRRNIEPRRPEVAEIDLTPDEWAALQAALLAPDVPK
jgi:hypothetical protein